jgi:hypothetical protein
MEITAPDLFHRWPGYGIWDPYLEGKRLLDGNARRQETHNVREAYPHGIESLNRFRF